MQRKRKRRAPWIAGALAVVAAAAVLLFVFRDTSEKVACGGTSGFSFTAQGGSVACAGAAVAHGVLPVGGVLDTGTNRAQLAIADIGTAELFPGTRVRLDRTVAKTRHELFLEQGRMHARVDAPPRMFAVTTPSTNVTDLGCEYTIEIDAKG